MFRCSFAISLWSCSLQRSFWWGVGREAIEAAQVVTVFQLEAPTALPRHKGAFRQYLVWWWSQLSTRSLRQMLCSSHVKIWNLTNDMKKMKQRTSDPYFWVLPIDLAFYSFFFCFLKWFSRFQILISELQSIWCNLLVLRWL